MALNPLLKKLVSQSAAKYKGGHSTLSKLKEGRNVLRIIAPEPNSVPWVGADGAFFRDLGVHWIKSDPNGKPLAVVGSEEICYQRPSVLAAAIDMAIASAYDEDTKKLYTEWKAKKSVILNVVNRDAGDEVQTLELTPTTFGKIMEIANLYDDQGINVFDHTVGMDFVITKTGKGLNTQYDVAVMPLAPGKTFKPVGGDQLNQASNLDEFISSNYFRGEEQKALNAIQTIAGIKVPQLGAPATPVAALTSSAATVADAPVSPSMVDGHAASAASAASAAAAAAAAAAASAPVAAPSMTPEQMQAEIARQAALLAAQQVQQAAVAQPAPVQPTPAPAAVTPTTGIADLGQDEQDALLAELNSIGA